MPGERKPFDKLRAILLTTCLFLAAMAGPLMGPVAVQGIPDQSPWLDAGNISTNPGNTATLEVNYDVSSEGVAVEDLILNVFQDGQSVGNTDDLKLSGQETPVKVDVSEPLGRYPVSVQIREKGGSALAEDSATIVISDPDITFSPLWITTEGEDIVAATTAENTGDSERTIKVPLYVDGEKENSRSLTLGIGKSDEVSMVVPIDDGKHEVAIGDTEPINIELNGGPDSGDSPGDGSDGDDGSWDDTPEYDVIKGMDVSHTGVGNAPSQDPKLRVSDPFGDVLMGAEVVTPSDNYELADIGADSSTQFEMVLKVHEDHEPLMLLGTAQDVTWTKEPISGENYYKVTVTANPMEAQYVDDEYPIEWGSDEGTYKEADIGYDAMLTVSFITSDFLSNANLDGATIATDAQSIGMPDYDPESKSLGLGVAGPHYETDGTTVNTGEYEAFLPDALLDEWGVTNPTEELQGSFNDQQFDSSTDGFQVIDEGVSGGVLVEFPIHYSAGTVSVSPADPGPGESGTDDSESDGPSYSPPSSWSPPSDTDDADDTDTTTTESETTTEPETTSEASSSDATTSEPATTTVEATTTTPPETSQTETATTTTRTETTTAATTIDTTTEAPDSTTEESGNGGGVPGFGPGAAVAALLAAAMLALRRSR